MYAFIDSLDSQQSGTASYRSTEDGDDCQVEEDPCGHEENCGVEAAYVDAEHSPEAGTLSSIDSDHYQKVLPDFSFAPTHHRG